MNFFFRFFRKGDLRMVLVATEHRSNLQRAWKRMKRMLADGPSISSLARSHRVQVKAKLIKISKCPRVACVSKSRPASVNRVSK